MNLQFVWSCPTSDTPQKRAPSFDWKPAASVCCCLDWGDAEVLGQREARVSVTRGFLGFGVFPDVLVPVAGVALQQQLRQAGSGGVEAYRQPQACPWGDAGGRAGGRAGAGADIWALALNQGQALGLVALLVIGIIDVSTRERLELGQVHAGLCAATCWELVWDRSSQAGRGRSKESADTNRTRTGVSTIGFAVFCGCVACLKSLRVRGGAGGAWQRHGLSVSECFLPSEVFQNPGSICWVPQVLCLVL